jgi:gentisate 1,2-dioxygenase
MSKVRIARSPADAGEPTPFVADLAAANLHPLWDRFRSITPVHPRAVDAPMMWRWQDVAPYAARAALEVPIDHIERRALILVNPAFGGETVTTGNLIGAFTVLEPCDRARPHRHTFAALRFATQADGAVTMVNGRRCEMKSGDLVLTPPWCWHGHINESSRRTVWFDAANLPLIRSLDANFFEPGDPDSSDFWRADADADRKQAVGHAPHYHHAGADTRSRLAAAPPGPDRARSVRYVNPATGQPAMPALDCHAVRLEKSVPTRRKRSTCNCICLVVSGGGRSEIGGQTFEWQQHDVFTVPHWNFASHEAIGGDADLFVVSDRVVYEQLDLLREEIQ